MNWKQIKVDINNVTYQQIMEFLNYAQATGTYRDRRLARILQEARLSDNYSVTNLIGKGDWHKRFEPLANAIGYDMGVQQIYRVVDHILYDIRHTRDWISDFKVLANSDFGVSAIGQLTVLGQAILGRATELCPIETGALRASGTLLVYDNYIVIYFDCPYATYVHDNLNNHHNVGQAKFLEVAMQEMLPYQTVWTEYYGENIVWCSIGLNNKVEYRHYE